MVNNFSKERKCKSSDFCEIYKLYPLAYAIIKIIATFAFINFKSLCYENIKAY